MVDLASMAQKKPSARNYSVTDTADTYAKKGCIQNDRKYTVDTKGEIHYKKD